MIDGMKRPISRSVTGGKSGKSVATMKPRMHGRLRTIEHRQREQRHERHERHHDERQEKEAVRAELRRPLLQRVVHEAQRDHHDDRHEQIREQPEAAVQRPVAGAHQRRLRDEQHEPQRHRDAVRVVMRRGLLGQP